MAGAVLMVLSTACGSGEDRSPAPPAPAETLDEIGEPEGELSLLALAGYVEDGSSDPDVDWVGPFERRTGCTVSVRYADSPEEVVSLFLREGPEAFDGAAVPGPAAGELIAEREVAAVDPALFPAYANVLAPLRGEGARHYVVGGDVFGVPALYGPNLLMYDRTRVEPAPTSWDVVLDPGSPYVGRIAMYDSAITIADAALYLAAHRPELGIEDPYALTPRQLDAATELLAAQEPGVGLYWTLFADQVEAFRARDVVVGAAWPIAFSLLDIDRRPVDAVEPVEGMTGWADTWMVAADAPHPNCMLMWMRWTLRADVQAQMAFWYGGAPSNPEACEILRRELGDFAELVDGLRFGRCGDEDFLASLALWRMPTVDCGDGRGRVCAGYPAWRLRWRSIRD